MPTDQQIALTVRTIIGADGNVNRPAKATAILAYLANAGITVEQAVDAINRDDRRRGVNPTLTYAAARDYLSAGTPPPTGQGGAVLPLLLAVGTALLFGV